MAHKKSLWSELQRERERRQRVARAQERTNEQTIKQILRITTAQNGTISGLKYRR